MALRITGLTKVKTLRANFKVEFGLTIRVYNGRSFADNDATLASIRKNDNKGGELSPKRNMKVGNLEDKIMDVFGIKTQISGSDDSYLCDNDYTLAKALEVDEKKIAKKESKNKESVESNQAVEDDDEEKVFSVLFSWADKFNLDADYFPRNIDELQALTDLNLAGEALTDLPKEIGNLTSLTNLDLSGNQLVELPKEIGNLTSLVKLGLRQCGLKEVPKELGNLSSLRFLILASNELKEVPKELGNLSSLAAMDLTKNQLKELPKEIRSLQSSTTQLYLDDIKLMESTETNDSSNRIKIFIIWYIDNELGDIQEDGEFEPITLNVPFDESDIESSVCNLFSNLEFIQLAEALWTNYSKNKPVRLNIEIEKIEIGDNSYEGNEDDWEEQYYLYWEDGSLVSNL